MTTATAHRVPLAGPFDLAAVATMGFGHRDESSFDGVMRMAFCVDGDYVLQVGVEVRQDGDHLDVLIAEQPGAPPVDPDRVLAQVARVVSADHDGDAYAAVCRRIRSWPGCGRSRRASGRRCSTPRTRRPSGPSSAPGGPVVRRFRSGNDWPTSTARGSGRRPVGAHPDQLRRRDSCEPAGRPRFRGCTPSPRPPSAATLGRSADALDWTPRRRRCSSCLGSARSTAR